jgi:hypothetical protein
MTEKRSLYLKLEQRRFWFVPLTGLSNSSLVPATNYLPNPNFAPSFVRKSDPQPVRWQNLRRSQLVVVTRDIEILVELAAKLNNRVIMELPYPLRSQI